MKPNQIKKRKLQKKTPQTESWQTFVKTTSTTNLNHAM